MPKRDLLTIVVVGIALGIAARLVDGIAPRWVGDIGAVWVLTAFWAGSRAEDWRRGIFAGVSCLVLACSSYYLWRIWVEDWIWISFLATVGVFWLMASIGVGAIAGYVGVQSRRSPEAWSVVSGAFLGEGVALWLLNGITSQVVLEVVIGMAVVAAIGVRSRRVVALTVAATLVIAAFGVTYRLGLGLGKIMRRSGYTMDRIDRNGGTSMRDRPGGRPLTARDLRR